MLQITALLEPVVTPGRLSTPTGPLSTQAGTGSKVR